MQNLTAENSEAHLPQLDVLRALAAVGVLLFHAYGDAYRWQFFAPGNPWLFLNKVHNPAALIGFPAVYGNAGVPIFFMLSGFCIHYSYLRRPAEFRTWRFVCRRFWRLYPAYIVSMVVILAVNQSGPYHASLRNVVAHLLLVQNLISPATFLGINPPYWSLAVEWQYYLIYPILLLVWGPQVIGRGLVVLLGAFSLALAMFLSAKPAQDFRLLLPFGFFHWCLGAWLAARYREGREPLIQLRYATAIAALILLAASRLTERLPWEWFAWAIAGTALFEAWVRRGTSLAVRPVVWLGACSYSIYLWHFWVTKWLVFGSLSPGGQFALNCIIGGLASVAVAAVSYYVVERPGVAVGRWVMSGRKQQIEPSLSVAAAP